MTSHFLDQIQHLWGEFTSVWLDKQLFQDKLCRYEKESPLNYRSVQNYYNNLFGGGEVDEDWSHWSFSNNYNVPGELFLFRNDTTCLEIIAYLAKQR